MSVTLEQAIAYHQAGKLDEAAQTYRELLEAQPDNANALHLLGLLLHQRGQTPEGLTLIERALALNPDYAAAHANRAGIMSAVTGVNYNGKFFLSI